MSRIAYAKLLRFIEARLSPGGELGLHLTAGIVLLLGAVSLFAEIAEDMVERDTIWRIDHLVAHWFNVHAFEPMTGFMLVITHWHSVPGVLVMGCLLAAWFWRRNAPYWLLALLISLPGGMVVNVLLKHAFQRQRPVFDEPLLTLATYSFPSGHTAGATLFYGLLASYIVVTSRRWRVRVAAMAGAVLMVGLVALSRIYLGVHFVSDTMAAVAGSAAWLTICITSISSLRRRRAARKEQ
ncbi:phosphatase PAP2 family protein [Massilia endophytica]|uniref:phosphatase PAP2 family protein n=1 Tax=Massilia endophytica TaxID=2899220 RepID=UPI001E62C2B1|nr:phosphatase PAP2 family protein [Massilia endophytica]UGQ47835.1 phosphatase PAP2 family protein [Massilia endophytica]